MADLVTEMLADSPLMLLVGSESSGSTIADASGHGHSMAIQANVTLGGTALAGGLTSMVFSGTDPSYGTVTHHADFSQGDGPFSLAMMFKQDGGVGATRVFLDKGATGADEWSLIISSTNFVKMTKGQDNGTMNFITAAFTDTASIHLLVVTYDGTTTLMYLDGTSVGDTSTNQTIGNSTSPLIVGAAQDHSNRFPMHLSHVGYFPSALSAGRVTAYQAARSVVAATDTEPAFAGSGWF